MSGNFDDFQALDYKEIMIAPYQRQGGLFRFQMHAKALLTNVILLYFSGIDYRPSDCCAAKLAQACLLSALEK